jgi:hypothetical protein
MTSNLRSQSVTLKTDDQSQPEFGFGFADPALSRKVGIHGGGDYGIPAIVETTELGVTEERLHEYRKLLKSLDTRRLDRNKKGTVYFMLWASQVSYVVNCLNEILA